LHRRGLEHPEHFQDAPDVMVVKSLMLAMNDLNRKYAKECDHLNYSDTMTGAVCNDCGKEEEE